MYVIVLPYTACCIAIGLDTEFLFGDKFEAQEEGGRSIGRR